MCDFFLFLLCFFLFVTICMYYFDNRDEPPLPSKFCFKKKRIGQEEFPLGVHVLGKSISSGGNGKISFLLCSTHQRRKGMKRKLTLVSMLPINILLINLYKVRKQTQP